MNTPFKPRDRLFDVKRTLLSVAAVLTLTCGCSTSTGSPGATPTQTPGSTTSSETASGGIDADQLSSACLSVERSVPIIAYPLLDLANGGGGTLSRTDRLALARLASDLASLQTGGSFAEESTKFVSAAGAALESDYIDNQTAADAFLPLDKMRQLCGVPAAPEPSKT